jgi:hypothetical protein
MRLLADENSPFPVVEALRRFGDDVLTLNDLGKAGQALTDVAVLRLASDDSRALLTLNRNTSFAYTRRMPRTRALSSAHSIWTLTAKPDEFEQRLAHGRHLRVSFCVSIAQARVGRQIVHSCVPNLGPTTVASTNCPRLAVLVEKECTQSQ